MWVGINKDIIQQQNQNLRNLWLLIEKKKKKWKNIMSLKGGNL
jgi:hypothetical protein